MNLKELKRKLDGIIKDTVNRQLTDKIGRNAVNNIKTRTRKGFGVAKNEGPTQRLKKLKPQTVKRRRDLKKQGRLSGKTEVAKSNLTRSGKMLNNIKYSNSDNEINITLKSDQQDKAKKVSVERPFMNLSKSEVNEILKIIEIELINDIKKKGL